MAIERTYNIPLRREFRRAPGYKKAERAVRTLREFVRRHLKSDNINIGRFVNQKIWEHGMKNPPHHIKVNVKKEDDGLVRVELFGKPFEEEKKKEKGEAEEKPEQAEEKTKAEEKKGEKPDERAKKRGKKAMQKELAAEETKKEN